MSANFEKTKTTKIGAVSYLNTKPLVYQLQHFLPDCRVVFDLPSRLADRLARGELDVALIPSVEFFQNPGYRVLSDACIGCRGPVLSVKLLSRRPLEEIERLALDEGSRTSVALTRILLKEVHGVSPQLESLPIGADFRETTADAVLLIGDRAIRLPDHDFTTEIDLGEYWVRWSKLPFVFAMWVAREDRDYESVARGLSLARDAGLQNLEAIAETHCGDVGLSREACLGYLRDNLHFVLGADERRGLSLYFQHVAELGETVTT